MRKKIEDEIKLINEEMESFLIVKYALMQISYRNLSKDEIKNIMTKDFNKIVDEIIKIGD